MHAWMDGWMDAWMDGMDEWMDRIDTTSRWITDLSFGQLMDLYSNHWSVDGSLRALIGQWVSLLVDQSISNASKLSISLGIAAVTLATTL